MTPKVENVLLITAVVTFKPNTAVMKESRAWTKELHAVHGVNKIVMENVFQTLMYVAHQTKKFVNTLANV